jgi:hypothetical protein
MSICSTEWMYVFVLNLLWPSDCVRICAYTILQQKLKGTILLDWICRSMVLLDRPWKGHHCYRFFIFYFWSWISDKSSNFWAASCKNEPNLLLVWFSVCMCSNHDLFRQTGRDINYSLDHGLWVKNSNIPKSKLNRAALWRSFWSNRSAPANRKIGFYATVIRTSRRLD